MRYTLGSGRVIERDGIAVAYVARYDPDPCAVAPLAPAECDDLAHRVVAALNLLEQAETALKGRC